MLNNSKSLTRMIDLCRERQNDICAAIEAVDGGSFKEDTWTRDGGGGGITRVIEGDVIEKGGVNTSVVHGTITETEAPLFSQLVTKVNPTFKVTTESQFSATGISLVLHPKNPFVPTVHANYRYFELSTGDETVWWYGGGADLTPYYLFEDDARHFHAVHKTACETYKEGSYTIFKKECDEYFHIKHRNESRGIGGIFFDYQHGDSDALYAFASTAGTAFIEAYCPIVSKRKDHDYSDEHLNWQRIRRGRYAEFNLVYDRGTLFGLKTGGRIESILMSMPPLARWDYDVHPEPGTEEARLNEILQNPIEWV